MKMSKNRMKILEVLLKNPKMSDRKAADLAKVSQPTVTRIRAKLVKSGLLTFSAYPDLAKLGYSILAFHELYDFNVIPSLRIDDRVIYLAKQPSKVFVVSVHKGIESLEQFEAEYPKIINEMHIVTPLADTMKPLQFSQLLKTEK